MNTTVFILGLLVTIMTIVGLIFTIKEVKSDEKKINDYNNES
jgi:type III secretory pathway component EscU